jgi:CheY-like chemotaxis protein
MTDADGSMGRTCRSRLNARGGPVRILLLDDNPDVLRSSQRALERLGHVVTPVSTCGDAVAIEEHFDVAVLDVELPDGSGVDVARRLLAEGKIGAVVFYSGLDHADLGGLGVAVLKPDFDGLRAAIDTALSGR